MAVLGGVVGDNMALLSPGVRSLSKPSKRGGDNNAASLDVALHLLSSPESPGGDGEFDLLGRGESSFLREKYNQARKRYEEHHHNTSPAAVANSKRASRVYYALYTLLYTSICATKTEMLDKYVRSKGPLLPLSVFDPDEWEPALRAAQRSRSAELEAAHRRVEEQRGELQGRLAAAITALRQQRAAIADVHAEVAHDVDHMKQQLAHAYTQVVQAVTQFAHKQAQAVAPAEAMVALMAQVTALAGKMDQLQRDADAARRAGSAEAAASTAEARAARLELDAARRQMVDDARAAQERLSAAEARNAALAASLTRCQQALAGQLAGTAGAAASAVDTLLEEKAALVARTAALEEALLAREADVRALREEGRAALAHADADAATVVAAAAAAARVDPDADTRLSAPGAIASEEEVEALRRLLQTTTQQLRSAVVFIGTLKVDLESTRATAAALEQEVAALRADQANATAAAPAPVEPRQSLVVDLDVASPRLPDPDLNSNGNGHDPPSAGTGPPSSSAQAETAAMRALEARNVGLKRQVAALTGQVRDMEVRCRALERERDGFAAAARERTPTRTPPPEAVAGGGSGTRRTFGDRSPARPLPLLTSFLLAGAGPGVDRLRPLYGSSESFSFELAAFEKKKAGPAGRALVPAARGANADGLGSR